MIGGSKIAGSSPGRPIEAPSDRRPAQSASASQLWTIADGSPG